MKILAIIGSPRKKGNTYRVVEQINKHLTDYDKNIDYEYLFLKNCNLQMCTGCFACIAKGADKCPLKDDRILIKAKMAEADGIIFAAPNYAMAVPGIMKNFIDRFAYTLHRPCFFDKVFLAVTTTGGVMGTKQALAQLSILSAGGRLAKKLGVAVPPIPMAGFEKRAKKKILKTSQVFYRALQQKQRKLPGLADWAYFHSFKALTRFENYRNVCPADYAYYKDKEEYFYPIKGHHARRLIGKTMKSLMRFGLGFFIKKPNGKDVKLLDINA